MTTALRRPSSALAVVVVSTALLLAGCSSGTSEAEPTATAEDTEAAPDQATGGEQPGGNGISGLIAAITDSVMQVQSTDSQTAVTWTDETEVTKTVTVALDSITVGSCVLAMAPSAEEGSTATTVATTVTVSDPVDGECAAGFGSFGGGAGGGGGGEIPEDFEPPEGMTMPEDGEIPEGLEGMEGMGGAGFGQMVNGLLTAVSGSTLTVETTDADGVVTTQTIQTDTATVVTATVAADTTAIAVGLCATVGGETDTRGGMTATTIALSDAGDDGCTTAMGGIRTTTNGGEDD